MEPLTSEGKVVSNSSITDDPSSGAELSVIKPKMQMCQKHHHNPGDLLLFSDPLDGTSSDEHSFDEEDMFGSDSDAEISESGPMRRSNHLMSRWYVSFFQCTWFRNDDTVHRLTIPSHNLKA